MTGDEKFFAWLDGELEDADAREMEAIVAADTRLARLAEQHRAMQSRLRHAFDPVIESEVPERLHSALFDDSPPGIDAAAGAVRRTLTWTALPQWAAMAATLVIGLLIGLMVPQRSTGPVQVEAQKIYAAAALDRALDTQLASAPEGGIRIGLTFRDRSGNICRSFTQPGASGLACRSGERWQVLGLFAAPEGHASEYRMAAGMDPNLAALVDSTMAGEPLDAAQEKIARDEGWR